MIVAFIMVFVLGIILGVMGSWYANYASNSGDLLITSDEDGYYLSLELNEPIQNVKNHSTIIFKVKDISQK